MLNTTYLQPPPFRVFFRLKPQTSPAEARRVRLLGETTISYKQMASSQTTHESQSSTLTSDGALHPDLCKIT
jgi:hypothetical protein